MHLFSAGVCPLLQRPRKESVQAFRALILFQAPPRELFGWGDEGDRAQLKFHVPAHCPGEPVPPLGSSLASLEYS